MYQKITFSVINIDKNFFLSPTNMQLLTTGSCSLHQILYGNWCHIFTSSRDD